MAWQWHKALCWAALISQCSSHFHWSILFIFLDTYFLAQTAVFLQRLSKLFVNCCQLCYDSERKWLSGVWKPIGLSRNCHLWENISKNCQYSWCYEYVYTLKAQMCLGVDVCPKTCLELPDPGIGSKKVLALCGLVHVSCLLDFSFLLYKRDGRLLLPESFQIILRSRSNEQ